MIEFFFDCSSPWTYLAFHNLQPLAAELGVAVQYKPVLVGGIFNTVNPSVYAQRENVVPLKRDYMIKDLRDWSREAGLHIIFPPTIFPVNSVKAMRGCIWLERLDRLEDKDSGNARFLRYTAAVFKAYWTDDLDISNDAVLVQICRDVGVDPDAFLAGIAQPAIKEEFKANTDEAIRRGAFGSPTFFVNGEDMYFGNDRLALVRAAVLRAKAG